MITIDFDALRIPEAGRILDIGCGSGRHTAEAYGVKDAFVVGADPSFEDLGEARQRLDFHHRLGVHGGGRWRLLSADATHLPFPDGWFDVVICSEVLEHITAHRQAIREIVRVLRPGGSLAVSVPRRWPEALCWLLSPNYRNTEGGHVRIFVAQSLIKQIQAKGMTHRFTHFAHSLHSPYWWIKCLVGPDREDCLPVKLYHRFLTWDIMARPRQTRLLERLLNPVCGKSVVFYFSKDD